MIEAENERSSLWIKREEIENGMRRIRVKQLNNEEQKEKYQRLSLQMAMF